MRKTSICLGGLLLVFIALPTFAGGTRVLFSHYAPGFETVSLTGDSELLGGELQYGETSGRYAFVDSGNILFSANGDGEMHVETDANLEPGDYSVFFHLDMEGNPALTVVRDTLAAFEFPAPFDFETADGNAAGRFLSFANMFQENVGLLGTVRQFFNGSDGSVTEGGEFLAALSLDDGVAAGGEFPATVNSSVYYTVAVDVGTVSDGALSDVIITESFDLPAGTTDYVLIGNADSLQIVERPRPGARSLRVDGIYGELGINGSGIQLYELPDIGRVFGFFYTYDENGAPTWYYVDSRCDLDRGFQCTTPGLVVASGTYIVAVYQTSNGMLAPNVDADLELVGAARLRVPRQLTPSANLIDDDYTPPPAQLSLHLTPPTGGFPLVGTPDAEFEFSLIQR